jgi:hypothetical protein
VRPSAFSLSVIAATVSAIAALATPARARAADAPPDGWVVFGSNREDGRMEIYWARTDGGGGKRLTREGGTFASLSADGSWVKYTNDAVVGETFFMRPDGSEKQQKRGYPLFWLHDNSGFALLEPDGNAYIHDLDTGDRTLLYKGDEFPEFAASAFHPYAMTHDNRYLFVGSDVYNNGFTGTNGTYQQGYSAVLIDMLDKRKIYMVGLGCWPFTPPTGDLIYHIRGEHPGWPDIYRMNLADLESRQSYEPEVANLDENWGHEYHPHISNDNQWLVYMTSNGCHWDYSCNNEIFLHRLGTGPAERIRVTDHPSFDGFPDMFVGPEWKKSAEPKLVPSPRWLTFYARAGVVPPAQVIKLKNVGGGALGGAQARLDPPVGWAEIATSDTAITVTLNPARVARGRHKTTIALTMDGAPGGPTMLPVSLDADDSFPEVVTPPDAGAPPDAAADTADAASPASPALPVSPKESGGGCSFAGAAGAGTLPLLLLLYPLLRLRRRRPGP